MFGTVELWRTAPRHPLRLQSLSVAELPLDFVFLRNPWLPVPEEADIVAGADFIHQETTGSWDRFGSVDFPNGIRFAEN